MDLNYLNRITDKVNLKGASFKMGFSLFAILLLGFSLFSFSGVFAHIDDGNLSGNHSEGNASFDPEIVLDDFKVSISEYEISDVKIGKHKAKKIMFPKLKETISLKNKAEKDGKLAKDYFKLEKTKYFGDVDVRLMEKINVTKQRIKKTWKCNCSYKIVDFSPNSSDNTTGNITEIQEVCDTCRSYENYTVEEMREIEPENYILKRNKPIYELKKNGLKIVRLPSGKFGYSVWTDVNILGINIENASWWNSSWTYKQQINISNTAGNLTDYQVKITLNSTNFNYSHANTTGKDIRFTNSSDDLLDYWIESWNTSGSSYIWVNVTSLTNNTNTTIYMYYGNPSASSESNFSNTFTKDYGESGLKGLWHFDDGVSPTADSSGNGNDGTITGATWVGSDGGQWDSRSDVTFSTGDSLHFDGTNDYVDCGNDPIGNNDDVTFEVWAYPQVKYYILSSGGQTASVGYAIIWNNGQFCFGRHTETKDTNSDYFGSYSANQWYHLAGVYNDSAGTLKAYVNGGLISTYSANPGSYSNNYPLLQIGKPNNANDYYFQGKIDEVRIYNRTLSADEIKAQYERRKYASPEPTVSFGSEETSGDSTPPTSNSPSDASYTQNSAQTIGWILQDETGAGNYTILRNGTIQNTSTAWTNNTNLNVWVNTSTIGNNWNYTIYFNDSAGNDGIQDSVFINITECSVNADCGLCEKCSAYSCVNQLDSEDLKSECSASYDACSNAYTRQGPDGFCDGAGACDINDALLNVSAGNVCDSGADTNPTTGINCGTWSDCTADACSASEYWVGYVGDGTATCVDTDWQSASSTYNVPDNYIISATNKQDTCDTVNTGKSPSYTTCSNNWTRQGADGYCDGSGSLDTNDALTNVSAGNICFSGTDANPNATRYCGLWGNCIIGNVSADEYYVGYTGDGTATCVDTDWQASSTYWNTTAGSVINTTQHADTCLESVTPTLKYNLTGGEVNVDSPATNEDIHFNITCTNPETGETLTGYVQPYNGSASYGSVQSSGVSNNTETILYTLSSTYTKKGEIWTGEYWCGDSFSNTSKQNDSVTIQNSAPTIQVQNTFTNVSAGHFFNVTAGVQDIDGYADITATNISSSVGNCVNIANSTTGTYFNSTWNCSHTAGLVSTDIIIGFTDASSSYIQTTSSSNTYPDQTPTQPSQPTITPATAYTISLLTCSEGTSSDADGDSITYHYQFNDTADGSVLQSWSTNRTFDCNTSGCNKGDTIKVYVKATTTYANSSISTHGTKYINNSIPTDPTDLTLTAGDVKVTETLNGTCTDSTDADSDEITYFYEFYNTNDTATRQVYSTNKSYVIQLIDAHDQIRVRCIATTTDANSSYDEENKQIANTLPTQPTLINPDNGANISSIIMNWSASTDADSDSVNYYVLVNGTQACYTSDLNCSYSPSNGYYIWNVTPYDGYENGTVSATRTYTFDNIDPSITGINWITTGGFTDDTLIYNQIIDWIAVTASDTNLKEVNITVYDPDNTPVDNQAMTNNTATNWNYTSDITLNKAGTWNITIIGYDYADNSHQNSTTFSVSTQSLSSKDGWYGCTRENISSSAEMITFANYDCDLIELEDSISTLETNWNSVLTAINNSNDQNIRIGLNYLLDFNYNGSNSSWCEQESANISTGCGGLSTGYYTCTGLWADGYGCNKVSDGNWTSSGWGAAGQWGYIEPVYQKLSDSQSSSLWMVKDGIGTVNLTIPSSCWNYNTTHLFFKAGVTDTGNSENWQCHNTTGWQTLRSGASGELFEEKMFWNITTTGSAIDALSNISATFSDLILDPYSDVVEYISFELVSPSLYNDSTKYTTLNDLAENATGEFNNLFVIYSKNYNNSNLDNSYISYTEMIYLDDSTQASLINTENSLLKYNGGLNRVYVNLSSTLMTQTQNYQNSILGKLRGFPKTDSTVENPRIAEIDTTVNDFVVFNNQSSSQNISVDITNITGYSGKDAWDETNGLLSDNNTDGTFDVLVSGYSATMVFLEPIEHIQMVSSVVGTVYKGGVSNTENFNYTNDTKDGGWTLYGAQDIQIELFDPHYKMNTFITYYGWVNVSYVANWSAYDIIIFDDETTDAVSTLLSATTTTDLFCYVSVADYNNSDAWSSAKEGEVDSCLALNSSTRMNVFVDGLDIGIGGTNFSSRMKDLVDYVKITKDRKVGLNTYTVYEDFCSWSKPNGFCMKESCVRRWNGADHGDPDNYTFENWTLELEKSEWYQSHNINVLCQAFDNRTKSDSSHQITNRTRMEDIYFASLVLGYDYFYLSQPDFGYAHTIYLYDVGENLANTYSTDDNETYYRAYSNGIVYYNSSSHDGWIDDGREINNIEMCFKLVDPDDGPGNDEDNMIFQINNGNFYEFESSEIVWSANGNWHCKNLITSDYATDSGAYYIHARMRDRGQSGDGIYVLYDTNIEGTGKHSWWDNTAGGPPYNWNVYAQNQNWMVRISVNETKKTSIDITDKITQSTSNNGILYLNLSSDYIFNKEIWSNFIEKDLTTFSYISYYNGSEWIQLNVTNNNDCDSNNPTFNTSIINGETHKACYKDTGFRIASPSLSTRQYLVSAGAIFTVTSNSPTNETQTNDNTTDFNFTVSGSESSYDCTLYLNDTSKGTNNSVSNDTATIITSTELSDGFYNWYINCTAVGTTNQSEIREITIDTIPPTVLSYYQWNSTNGTVDFGLWTEGFVSINWNLTDSTGINTSSCLIKVRNKNYINNYTNLSYIDDAIHPDYDPVTGYKNLTCYTEDLGDGTIKVSANMTRSYDWRPLNTAFDQDNAAHDNIYYSHGGRSTKIVFNNITNTVNTTFIFLADVDNQSATVADMLFYSCNSSYISGDFTNSPYCAFVGATTADATRDVNFGYIIGALTTDENGTFGGVVHTETMYGMSYCPGCTNTGNAWITYSTNGYEGHSETSPNKGVTWNTLSNEEFNVILHVIDNTQLEFNLTIDDNLGNQLSDLQADIYGALANLAPYGDINTDNITGGLISYYDIHNIVETGTIWINTTISDPNADSMNCSIYLLNNDSSVNQTLLSNYAIEGYGICPYEWDTTTIPDGDYRLNVTATDGLLTGYDESSGYIRIDNTNPSISYNPTTTSQGNYSQNWIFINITASDTNLDTVLFEWNGTNETFDNSSGNLYWENKIGLSDGTYTIKAYINDTAGNVNSTLLRTINLDTTPPSITILSPIEYNFYNNNLTINTEITDLSNISYAYYNITNSTNITATGGLNLSNNWDAVFDTTTTTDGNYILSVWANDTVGNANNKTVNFTIDNTNPQINFTLSQSSITIGNSITLTCYASDNLGDINLNLTRNGALIKTCYSSPCVSTYTPTSTGTKTLKCTVYDDVSNYNTSTKSLIVNPEPTGSTEESTYIPPKESFYYMTFYINPINRTEVEVYNDKNELIREKVIHSGRITIPLVKGEYKLKIRIAGYEDYETNLLVEKARTYDINLKEKTIEEVKKEEIEETYLQIFEIYPSIINLEVYKEDELLITKELSSGEGIYLPEGEYFIIFKSEGYEPYEATLIIIEDAKYKITLNQIISQKQIFQENPINRIQYSINLIINFCSTIWDKIKIWFG